MRTTGKPFSIDKKQVYEAYKAVKSNAGSAGVDAQTIEQFEADLQNNLYKLWNRMSSGSYFPPPVRAVSIPKKAGGQRILGVPTVADRVAQMVVKQHIEPELDPVFLADSYGYRPRKSALDAVGVTRQRCWKYDWVLEFDIKGLFDNIDHELLLRAVRKHVTCKWALLYIERWLTVPMEHEDGTKAERKSGTPQGGVVSPILSNLQYVNQKARTNRADRAADLLGVETARTQHENALHGKLSYSPVVIDPTIFQEIHPLHVSCRNNPGAGIMPKIMQARDLSPACRAMDPGDTSQRVECGLNGADSEPRAVPVRQKEGSLALRKPAPSAQGHIGIQRRGKLGPDRRQTTLVELRGAYGQNAFRQIDVRQRESCRFAEAQPGPV